MLVVLMEIKKIVFDIDGVLRNLYPIIRRKYNLWSPSKYEDWDDKGYNIYDLVEKDYSVLVKAKPTKYVKEIQKFIEITRRPIEIWSHQPTDWVSHTEEWTRLYFDNPKFLWLKPEEKYNRLQEEKNTILIEDNPNFKDYNRVWLISHPYNEDVKCDVRIKTLKDLRRKLYGN